MKLFSLLIIGAALCFGAVDINKADKDELMGINGVGEAKANAILEYRKKHNCFSSIEELKEIKGVGDRMLEKNRSSITASECKK